VCTTWKCNGENFYLMDVYRARLTYPELKKAAVELYRRFHPGTVIIEDQASGTALIQELEASGLYGIKPYRAEAGSDKRSRFHGQSIKFENGRVFLPEQAPWLDEYIREITGFPGTKHDDQVDSTTQALEHLNEAVKSYNWWKGIEHLSNLCRNYPQDRSRW
jgi:predicted phage terminase large subunit-like protein